MNPLLPAKKIFVPVYENTPSPAAKDRKRPPLTTPESKSSARLSAFLDLNLEFSGEFPFESCDPSAIERLKWVLGKPQLPGSDFKKKPYIIKNHRANTWLEWVQEKLGFDNLHEWYLVGSSASFVSGKTKLIEGLQFLQNRLPEALYKDTLRKVEQWDCIFNDIDFKIKVKDTVDLEKLGKELNELNMVEASYNLETKTLLIRVKDENGHGVDFYIYSSLAEDYALNTDNWRINLKTTVLQPIGTAKTVNEIIQYQSHSPWSWWLGQVFKVIEKKETTNRTLFSRLVDREVRSHIARQGTESLLFNAWSLNEYSKDKDTSVRGLFRKLRIQHIALDHRHSVDIKYLLNQTSQSYVKLIKNRFLRTVFSALHEKRADLAPYMHATLECIAIVALHEGWDNPFSVKLVKHDGKWMMRMRLEGSDLLLQFNPEDSLSKLPNPHSVMWAHLKRVMHSLWLDGMHAREAVKTYRTEIEKLIQRKILKNIKQLFLHGTAASLDEKFILSQQNTLAEYLIPMCSDPNELFWLGMEVLREYNQASKQKLCWLAVESCLKYQGCDRAAELIERLRNEEIDPEDGYEVFFIDCLRGNYNASVLKACNPLSIELNWMELANKDAKTPPIHKFLQMIDNSEITAEEYIRTVKFTRTNPRAVSEATLIKILNHLEPKSASDWILKYDKPQYTSDEYKDLICKLILNASAALPPSWVLAFLNSGRFTGDSVAICTFMISQNISTNEKSELLRFYKIEEIKLWQQIAGEYLQKTGKWPQTFMEGSGIPYDVLANWCNVIDQACMADVVVPFLKTLKDTHGLKGIVLLHLLKQWGKIGIIDPAVLALLDPGKKKLPWKDIVAGAKNGKDILSKLKDPKVVPPGSHPTLFDLYYSLMHAIAPSEEHYFTGLMEFIDNLEFEKALTYCKKRQFKECLLMKPKLAVNFLKKMTSPENIGFVLEIAHKKDYLDEELFKLLLVASFQLSDNGAKTENVIDSSPKIIINEDSLIQKMLTQAVGLLGNPKGNLHAVAKIWKLLPHLTKCSSLAPSHRLMGLLKSGYIDLVIKMLNDAADEDLKKVDPKLYCEILRLLKMPEKKIELLSVCQVTSTSLRKIWEDLSVDPELAKDIYSRLRLIPIGQRMQVEITVVENVAMGILSSICPGVVIQQKLIDSIYNLLELPETKEKVKIWTALKNSGRITHEKLWSSGCAILASIVSHPPVAMVSWLINNRHYGQLDVLWPLIPQVLPKLPDDLIQKFVNGFVRKEAVKGNKEAREFFWKYTTSIVLSNEEMDILQPTPEQKALIVEKLISKCNDMPFIKGLIESKKDFCIDMALELLKKGNSVIDNRLFPAIMKLEPQQRMKFEVIMIEEVTDEKVRAMFKLSYLSKTLTAQSSLEEAASYAQQFKIAVRNNYCEAVTLFLPPILEYIFGGKRDDNEVFFEEILSCIDGVQSSIIASRETLKAIKSSTELTLISIALSFICKSIKSELEQLSDSREKAFALICDLLEDSAFLIFTDDSLLKFAEPLLHALEIVTTKSNMIVNVRPIYVLCLLFGHKFDLYIKPNVEIDCITYAIEVLSSMKTRTAIDTVQHLMCEVTYRFLYAHPKVLAKCNAEMIKGTFEVYNTLYSFQSVYRLLFKNLLPPPGNDVDMFQKNQHETGINRHDERLRMILLTIIHILAGFPEILPDLINFIHRDIVSLFGENDTEIWGQIAATLYNACGKHYTADSFNALALLLVTLPSKNVNAIFKEYLEIHGDRDLIEIMACAESKTLPVFNKNNPFSRFLAFSYHIRKCESGIIDLNTALRDLQHPTGLTELLVNLKYSIDYFDNVVIFTSQKRLFNVIDGILAILNHVITYEKSDINYFIQMLIVSASSLHPDYRFKIAMAIARIYRKEFEPLREKLLSLGGSNSSQIDAEMACQLMKDNDFIRYSSFPIEAFIKGNFKDLIEHEYTSSIYTSHRSLLNFLSVYIGGLNSMFVRLKASGDKSEFKAQLSVFRKHTDIIIQKCGDFSNQRLTKIFDMIEEYSPLLVDKQLCEDVLNFTFFNLKCSDASHFPQDKIFEFVGRFTTLSFIYGPDIDNVMAPNKFHKEVIRLADKLCRVIYYPEKGIGRTGEACMYLWALDAIENTGHSNLPLNLKKATMKYLFTSLKKYHNPKLSDWFKFWGESFLQFSNKTFQ